MKTIGRERACVVYLGPSDFKQPRDIERAFEEIVRVLRRKRVVLDFSNVVSLASLAAGAVIFASTVAAEKGVELKFAGIRPQVLKLLRKLGLAEAVEVHETVEEALASFKED